MSENHKSHVANQKRAEGVSKQVRNESLKRIGHGTLLGLNHIQHESSDRSPVETQEDLTGTGSELVEMAMLAKQGQAKPDLANENEEPTEIRVDVCCG